MAAFTALKCFSSGVAVVAIFFAGYKASINFAFETGCLVGPLSRLSIFTFLPPAVSMFLKYTEVSGSLASLLHVSDRRQQRRINSRGSPTSLEFALKFFIIRDNFSLNWVLFRLNVSLPRVIKILRIFEEELPALPLTLGYVVGF